MFRLLETWAPLYSIPSWSAEKCYMVITGKFLLFHNLLTIFISRRIKHSSSLRNIQHIKEIAIKLTYILPKFSDNLFSIHCVPLDNEINLEINHYSSIKNSFPNFCADRKEHVSETGQDLLKLLGRGFQET